MKKAWLLLKLGFLSVFGTSKGLKNVEEEIEIILGKKKRPESGESPRHSETDHRQS